jgi:uncharacterized membrane protein
MIRSTLLTRRALLVVGGVILGTATFLAVSYDSLPGLLPVHFKPDGFPNGWQYKTVPRVLMPVFVQLALALTLGGIGALLLFRRGSRHAPEAPDVKAATTAAEAVALIALVWFSFQVYAAMALVRMWRIGRPGLGAGYVLLEVGGLALTVIVGIRARARLGRPEAGLYVAEHWRLGQLYCNGENPALFVPTRDGSRWTLNFGRRAAVALLAVCLVAGVAVPTLILAIALRS